MQQQFADAGVEFWGCGSVCEFHSPDPAVVQKNIETCKQFVRAGRRHRRQGRQGAAQRPAAKASPTAEDAGADRQVAGRPAARPRRMPASRSGSRSTAAAPPTRRTCKTIMEHAATTAVGVTWNSNADDVVQRLGRGVLSSCCGRGSNRATSTNCTAAIPYRELFRLLRETGYDRVTLCEIQGMPDVATGERLMRYYKALWTELTRRLASFGYCFRLVPAGHVKHRWPANARRKTEVVGWYDFLMSTELVTVAVLDNPEHAAFARNVLDAAGIPSFIADENMVGMAWHMAGALGGVKVQVSAEDEEDARALLEKDIDFQIETGGSLAQKRRTTIASERPPFSSSEKTNAIAAGMPHPTLAETDDDDDEPTPTIREKNATASLRMAVLGLIFAPILLLAAYMLFQVVGSDERLEGKARRHVWITAAILGGVVLLIMLLISIPTHAP